MEILASPVGGFVLLSFFFEAHPLETEALGREVIGGEVLETEALGAKVLTSDHLRIIANTSELTRI